MIVLHHVISAFTSYKRKLRVRKSVEVKFFIDNDVRCALCNFNCGLLARLYIENCVGLSTIIFFISTYKADITESEIFTVVFCWKSRSNLLNCFLAT